VPRTICQCLKAEQTRMGGKQISSHLHARFDIYFGKLPVVESSPPSVWVSGRGSARLRN
jgi:hypothetical protein